MNQTLDQLREKRNKICDELTEINKQIDAKLAATVVRCPNKDCSRGYEIRELDYIQTHWYDPPSGCTDGDRWYAGEGQWKCPVCGKVTRLYDKPDITALKRYFKQVVDTHNR